MEGYSMKKKFSTHGEHPDFLTIVSLWVFPFCAIALTSWLLYDFYSQRGPLIYIEFSDASSVEANRTPLRFRGINVGRVESVVLTNDTQKVSVAARLTKEAKDLAVEGAKFWIVQPEVDFEGIRGLETLFKGPYIRIESGKGKPQRKFIGFTGSLENDTTTTSFILKAPAVSSIDTGDSVTYRGLKVGSVSSIALDGKSQKVEIRIKIEKKFSKLIREYTAFWIKSGVDAKFGLLGADIKINSMETLMRGGIALAVPNEPGDKVKEKHEFVLQESPPKDWISWSPEL
jgi:paraquat-inducible protein B